jgi:hypothetical protein
MPKNEEHIIDEEKPLSLSPRLSEKNLKRLLDDDDYLPNAVDDSVCGELVKPDEFELPDEEDDIGQDEVPNDTLRECLSKMILNSLERAIDKKDAPVVEEELEVIFGEEEPEIECGEEDCGYDETLKESSKSVDEFHARQENEKAQEEELKRKDEEEKKKPEDNILTEDKMARLYPMPRYELPGWTKKFITIEASKVGNIFLTENKAYHWYITPDEIWRAFIDADAVDGRELKSNELIENTIN